MKKTIYAAAIPFAVLLLIAIFAPLIEPYNPEKVVGLSTQAPSAAHLFGTDSTGMDVFSRVVAGFRIDLVMGLIVTLLSTVIGLVIGLIIGMGESSPSVAGAAGRGANRLIDLADAIPPLIVGIVVVGLFGANIVSLSIALAFILTPTQVRLTRAEVLRVRSDAYLEAARMAGLRPWQITLRHVLPNACRPAIENSSLVFGVSVVVAAALGFLGVGLVPPTPEWGAMISKGVSDAMLGTWWTALFPAVALCVAVACASGVSGVLTRVTRGHSLA
ncbi:ABC transporter permease [Frondihabitans cladoniiphilus]|uniref:ABC transmembrane type-1 domain-containing protein n=1 Tax=Frondihabitans cladoniiphilus TaxID=715785 RepID=A0ABP8VYY4_9MICO